MWRNKAELINLSYTHTQTDVQNKNKKAIMGNSNHSLNPTIIFSPSLSLPVSTKKPHKHGKMAVPAATGDLGWLGRRGELVSGTEEETEDATRLSLQGPNSNRRQHFFATVSE